MTTFPVIGTTLTATTYQEFSDFLVGRPPDAPVLAVDFANTHVVTLRRHDPTFRATTDAIDIFLPDGMPLIWCLNARGAKLTDRVYGPTFTRLFLEKVPPASTHYLVGGSPDCGEKFRERMLQLNPSINFVGGYHGFCSLDGLLEDGEVVKEIQRLRPDYIWVGLGAPKQYAWIARTKPLLSHGVILAVGFAFDVNAGTKKDAPAWMQRNGLTWLFRLLSEPRRLAGRYFKWNTLFLWYLARERGVGK